MKKRRAPATTTRKRKPASKKEKPLGKRELAAKEAEHKISTKQWTLEQHKITNIPIRSAKRLGSSSSSSSSSLSSSTSSSSSSDTDYTDGGGGERSDDTDTFIISRRRSRRSQNEEVNLATTDEEGGSDEDEDEEETIAFRPYIGGGGDAITDASSVVSDDSSSSSSSSNPFPRYLFPAYAGSGKSTTLYGWIYNQRRLDRKLRILYTVYNRTMCDDAIKVMKTVADVAEFHTFDSLAFKQCARMDYKIQVGRSSNKPIVDVLKNLIMSDVTLTPLRIQVNAPNLVNFLLTIILRFCRKRESVITPAICYESEKVRLLFEAAHINNQPLVFPKRPSSSSSSSSSQSDEKKKKIPNNDNDDDDFLSKLTAAELAQIDAQVATFKKHVPPTPERPLDRALACQWATLLWEAILKPESKVPLNFHLCTKIMQVKKVKLDTEFDAILVDEAQDVYPVIDSFMMDQPLPVAYAGDMYQEANAWNGAINAMRNRTGFIVYPLSKSFRFSSRVAKFAYRYLAWSAILEPTSLEMEGTGTTNISALPTLPPPVSGAKTALLNNVSMAHSYVDFIMKECKANHDIRTMCIQARYNLALIPICIALHERGIYNIVLGKGLRAKLKFAVSDANKPAYRPRGFSGSDSGSGDGSHSDELDEHRETETQVFKYITQTPGVKQKIKDFLHATDGHHRKAQLKKDNLTNQLDNEFGERAEAADKRQTASETVTYEGVDMYGRGEDDDDDDPTVNDPIEEYEDEEDENSIEVDEETQRQKDARWFNTHVLLEPSTIHGGKGKEFDANLLLPDVETKVTELLQNAEYEKEQKRRDKQQQQQQPAKRQRMNDSTSKTVAVTTTTNKRDSDDDDNDDDDDDDDIPQAAPLPINDTQERSERGLPYIAITRVKRHLYLPPTLMKLLTMFEKLDEEEEEEEDETEKVDHAATSHGIESNDQDIIEDTNDDYDPNSKNEIDIDEEL